MTDDRVKEWTDAVEWERKRLRELEKQKFEAAKRGKDEAWWNIESQVMEQKRLIDALLMKRYQTYEEIKQSGKR